LALVYLNSPRLPSLFASQSFPEELHTLERSLARQIVGFDTQSIHGPAEHSETALYEQPFAMFPGEFSEQPVKAVLHQWAKQRGMLEDSDDQAFQGVAVSEFARWSVGQQTPTAETVISAIREERSP